jgi:hypothetical protein
MLNSRAGCCRWGSDNAGTHRRGVRNSHGRPAGSGNRGGSDGRTRGGCLGCGFGLLALKDRLERVAWLGNVREVELWLLRRRLRSRSGPRTAGQVPAYLFGFIHFDGA